jgi:hypothetical protein
MSVPDLRLWVSKPFWDESRCRSEGRTDSQGGLQSEQNLASSTIICSIWNGSRLIIRAGNMSSEVDFKGVAIVTGSARGM